MQSQVHLTPASFLQLMKGVEAMDMGAELKSKILQSLDQMGSTSASATKLVASPQTMPCISAYFTNKDWDALNEASMLSDAVQTVVSRLKAVGLRSLKEDTKKQACALLLWWMSQKGMAAPSPATVRHGLLADFQALFASMASNAKVPSPKAYSHVPAVWAMSGFWPRIVQKTSPQDELSTCLSS